MSPFKWGLRSEKSSYGDEAGSYAPLEDGVEHSPSEVIRSPRPWSVATVCLCAYAFVVTLLLGWTSWSSSSSSSKPWALPNDAITNMKSPELAADHHRKSVYWGSPTHEQFNAWLELVEPTFFRVSRQELLDGGDDPETAVKLASGDGYLGSLGVFHEVHCLRRMRLWINKEQYYPNITAIQTEHELAHLDHCIESLRLSTMCKPNLALYTYQWEPNMKNKPGTRSTGIQECVRWESLDNWARSRSVGLNPSLLRPEEEDEQSSGLEDSIPSEESQSSA